MIEIPYGVALTLDIPVIKAGTTNYAASGDWSPAAGDVKYNKDGTIANAGTLPAAVTYGATTLWRVTISEAEAQHHLITITLADQTIPAVIEEQTIVVCTVGHPDAFKPGVRIADDGFHALAVSGGAAMLLAALAAVMTGDEPAADHPLSGTLGKINTDVSSKLPSGALAGVANIPTPTAVAAAVKVLTDTETGTARAGTLTTIQLETTTSSVDSDLDGRIVMLISGPGSDGQPFRRINLWHGSTRTADVLPAWEIAPTSETGYALLF